MLRADVSCGRASVGAREQPRSPVCGRPSSPSTPPGHQLLAPSTAPYAPGGCGARCGSAGRSSSPLRRSCRRSPCCPTCPRGSCTGCAQSRGSRWWASAGVWVGCRVGWRGSRGGKPGCGGHPPENSRWCAPTGLKAGLGAVVEARCGGQSGGAQPARPRAHAGGCPGSRAAPRPETHTAPPSHTARPTHIPQVALDPHAAVVVAAHVAHAAPRARGAARHDHDARRVLIQVDLGVAPHPVQRHVRPLCAGAGGWVAARRHVQACVARGQDEPSRQVHNLAIKCLSLGPPVARPCAAPLKGHARLLYDCPCGVTPLHGTGTATRSIAPPARLDTSAMPKEHALNMASTFCGLLAGSPDHIAPSSAWVVARAASVSAWAAPPFGRQRWLAAAPCLSLLHPPPVQPLPHLTPLRLSSPGPHFPALRASTPAPLDPPPRLTSQSGLATPMLHTSSCMSSALTVIWPRGWPLAYTSFTLAAQAGGHGATCAGAWARVGQISCPTRGAACMRVQGGDA